MKDINVFDIDAVTRKISFNFQGGREIVRGKRALIQKITLNLLNEKGSNAFDPNKGSNILNITGGAYASSEEDVVKTLLALAVEEIEQQILIEQQNIVFDDESLDEKLKSLDILDITYNSTTAAWEVTLFVQTAADTTSIIGI